MTQPLTDEQLTALRGAVAAKLAYWDALTAFEKTLVPEGELTDRQNDNLVDEVDNLATGLPSNNDTSAVTHDHLRRVVERVLR